MKHFFVLFVCCIHYIVATAQFKASGNDTTAIKQLVDSINRSLDKAVVRKEAAFLQKHYADDFMFTHSTGQIDSKNSWVNFVLKPTTRYISRNHDSTLVELHKDVAIVTDVLTVKQPSKEKETGFALRYIRVYVPRKKTWQLVSHRTTREWHLDD